MYRSTDLSDDILDAMTSDNTAASWQETPGPHPGMPRARHGPWRAVVGLPGGETAEVSTLVEADLEVLAVATSGPDLLAAVERLRPDLVLLHTYLRGANNRLPATFRTLCGAPTVLLVPLSLRGDVGEDLLKPGLSQVYPLALLAEAERIGCPFVVAWPPDLADLRMVATQAVTLAPATPLPAPGAPRGGAAPEGRAIVVRSDKGGVGKSGFAVNLACALVIRGGRRVLLIDLDIAGASLHTLLGLPVSPSRGLTPLHAELRGWPEGEPLDLGPYVVEYPPRAAAREDHGGVTREDPALENGAEPGQDGATLHLLMGPHDRGAAKDLASDDRALRMLLTAARGRYDDVIIDIGTDVTSHHHLLYASLADWVLIVVEPTDDALTRCADGQKQVMNTTSLAAARCRLVVNRVADARHELVLADIKDRLAGIGVLGLLPEDTRRWRLSMRRHLPWILSPERADRTSALVGAMEEIVTRLTPGVLPPRPRGLWAQLFSGHAAPRREVHGDARDAR